MRSWSPILHGRALCLLALGLAGCEQRQLTEQKPQPTKPAPAAQVERGQRVLLPSSAYAVRIDFDGDTLVMASAQGLRVFPASGPAGEIARNFGDTFALSGSRVVYFEAGRLQVSLRGAEPKVLTSVPDRPRLIVIDQEQVAWVSGGADGSSVLWSLDAGEAHEIAQLTGRVDTIALAADRVFFLEQGPKGTWRLGGAPLSGGTPTFREWQSGRVPGVLVAHGDLFYYDGPSRSVRRTSPDLASSDVLAEGVICSPLAVADRVVCARVGGLYELPLSGGAPKNLLAQGGFVTGLAAREQEVAWVSDAGADRLVLQRRGLQ